MSASSLSSCFRPIYHTGRVSVSVAFVCKLLSSDLGYVLVDAVERLYTLSASGRDGVGCKGNSYFEHNHSVSTDNDHANADLLAAGPLLKRLVEHDVQVDLAS